MPDYTIKVDITSSDDKILGYAVRSLHEMRDRFVRAALDTGQTIYGSRYSEDYSNAVPKIKAAADRLKEIAALIEDIDLQLAQIKEDRPNVGKG